MQRFDVSDDILVSKTCEDCGFPILAPKDSPCPFCNGSAEWSVEQLQAVLYDVQLSGLQRIRLALRSDDVAAIAPAATSISPRLAEWLAADESAEVASTLATVLDVLLALYALSEEPAPPDQLKDVIEHVAAGELNRLPLPARGACFCGSGDRYKKCHGRAR